MLKKIEIIISILVGILGIYIIISSNFKVITFFQLLISSVLIIRGIRNLKEEDKWSGITSIAVGIIFIIIALVLKY